MEKGWLVHALVGVSVARKVSVGVSLAYLVGVLGPGWPTKGTPQIQLLLRKNALNSGSLEISGNPRTMVQFQRFLIRYI